METELTKADFEAAILSACPEHLKGRIAKTLAATEEEKAAREDRDEQDLRNAQLASFRRRMRANCGLRGNQWLNTWASYRYSGSIEQKNSQAYAMREARKRFDAFPRIERGLYLWSPDYGIGKDHFLHAGINSLMERKAVWDIRYYFTLDIEQMLFEEWGRHSDPETRTEEILRGCDLLLLGDLDRLLGVTNDSVKKVFFRVFDQAASVGRPIVFATGNAPLSVFDEIGERGVTSLGSRLAGIMDPVKFEGPDHRRER